MNQKRLIITSTISIILVSILFIGSTYSVFTTTIPDEEINSYKTGNLSLEVTGTDNQIQNILPTDEKNSDKLTPYRISVKNKGTVPYKFNIILEETTSSNKIDNKYIMTKVGTLDTIPLNKCKDNILKSDIIILPNEIVDIDIRIWIIDTVPNTEINKSFFAKIKIDGVATQNKKTNVDNTTLTNPLSTQPQDSQDQAQISDNIEKEESQ